MVAQLTELKIIPTATGVAATGSPPPATIVRQEDLSHIVISVYVRSVWNVLTALTSGRQELDGRQRSTISVLGRTHEAAGTAKGRDRAASNEHQFRCIDTSSASSFRLAAVDIQAVARSRRAECGWHTGFQA